MPQNNRDSGIVVINGTAYNAKTGQPIHNASKVENKKNIQQMTDLSQQTQPKTNEPNTETKEDNIDLQERKSHSSNERPSAKRAQQLHTIKKGSNEQVLDLRKTARAQKLKEDRKNEIQQENNREKSRPLNEPGSGPKLSQLDTKARLSRARQYQKSDSIHKFFPNSQPLNKSIESVAVNQSKQTNNSINKSKVQKHATNVNTNTINLAQSTNTDKKGGAESQLDFKKLAKTRELEKLVQKHPRYVTSEKRADKASQIQTNTSEQTAKKHFSKIQSLLSLLKFNIQPRVASYVTAGIATIVLVGFVAYLNMPQMALQVAANRAGFEAAMPAYKPSGFSFNGPISYAPGQIVISFGSHSDDRSFEIIQRKTTWDSTSLLENYVTQESENYIPVQQNGLTIYLFDDHGVAWVDGGVWYTIEGNSGLSSDQLLKVATSL